METEVLMHERGEYEMLNILFVLKKIAKLKSREWTRVENSMTCIEELINGATTEYPATLVRLTYMCREAFKRHNTINVILIKW